MRTAKQIQNRIKKVEILMDQADKRGNIAIFYQLQTQRAILYWVLSDSRRVRGN